MILLSQKHGAVVEQVRVRLVSVDQQDFGNVPSAWPSFEVDDDIEGIGNVRLDGPIREVYATALGYRPPEEFEQQIEASGPAESRSETMVFFENKENSGKISKGLLGKGTQMPSPSPDPLSC
jgi:hypothetical protein